MIVIQSLLTNLKFIKQHLAVFAFKLLIYYSAFIPIRMIFTNYFVNRTASEDLLKSSDSSVLIEFVMDSLKGSSSWFIFLILALFIVMFLIDTALDCAFISMFKESSATVFWSGIKGNFKNMLIVKLIFLVPYLFFAAVLSFITLYAFSKDGFALVPTLAILSFVGTFLLIIIKIIDTMKIAVVTENSWSFSKAIKSVGTGFVNLLMSNLLVMLCFSIGAFIYFSIDQIYTVDTSLSIIIMFLVHQSFVLLKQILRYSYTAAVMKM
jgi:hypothetical protein